MNCFRYVVKVSEGKRVSDAFITNDLSLAVSKERELKKTYGKDNVWIVDSLQEILVG